MKLPVQAKPVARVESKARMSGGIQPSGCCAQACVLGVCHCIAESPLCP